MGETATEHLERYANQAGSDWHPDLDPDRIQHDLVLAQRNPEFRDLVQTGLLYHIFSAMQGASPGGANLDQLIEAINKNTIAVAHLVQELRLQKSERAAVQPAEVVT